MTKLQWEFGDTILWLAFGRGKPFPVNIYMKNGNLDYKIEDKGIKLTETDRDEIERFIGDRMKDLKRTWNGNMMRRLNWPEKPTVK